MTTWLLEAYGTDSRYGNDVRYRTYTVSRKRAEAFARIPRIQFTDSGHGIVFHATELPPRAKRLPVVYGLSDYITEHLRTDDAQASSPETANRGGVPGGESESR